jgi:hypothetical protein
MRIISLKLISPILQANDLCVVSTIRQRPPHKLITSYNLPRHIPMTLHVHLPRLLIHTPSLTMSFANSRQLYFCSINSLVHICLPGFHRHYLQCVELQLYTLLSPQELNQTYPKTRLLLRTRQNSYQEAISKSSDISLTSQPFSNIHWWLLPRPVLCTSL